MAPNSAPRPALHCVNPTKICDRHRHCERRKEPFLRQYDQTKKHVERNRLRFRDSVHFEYVIHATWFVKPEPGWRHGPALNMFGSSLGGDCSRLPARSAAQWRVRHGRPPLQPLASSRIHQPKMRKAPSMTPGQALCSGLASTQSCAGTADPGGAGTPAPPAEDRSNRLPGLSARQRSNPVQGRNMQAETPPNVQPIECLFGATFQWTILLGASQPAADQHTVSRLTWLPIACTWRMPVILPGCSDSGSTASDFRELSFFVLDGTGACQDTHHPTKCAAPVPYARRVQEVPVTTSLFAARRD